MSYLTAYYFQLQAIIFEPNAGRIKVKSIPKVCKAQAFVFAIAENISGTYCMKDERP